MMKVRFIVFLLTLGLICGLALWLLRLTYLHQRHQTKMHQALTKGRRRITGSQLAYMLREQYNRQL